MPFALDIDLGIACEGWPDTANALVERAVTSALADADIEVAGPLEVSVLLTDDAAQKELNRQWRGKDSSTNVLSFPGLDPFAPVEGLLGDLSLALETVTREAEEMDISFADHFTHLLVHGTLHLCGYDHLDDEEALVMEGLETDILNKLGIADPYAEN